ncbi:MAG: DUF6706 family protein [Dysgonomonas sp.]
MTNIEAIIEDLRPYPIRRSLVERKCQKYGLESEGDIKDEKTAAKIVIEILVQMITLNNVSEGGVSISFNKDGVNKYIKSLCLQFGFDSSEYVDEPTVTYLGDI